MKDIRIGNDINVKWSIFGDGAPYILEGKDVSLYLCTPFGKRKVEGFAIVGNQITWTFAGKDQSRTGKYSLELVVNADKEGQVTTDACNFVNLVNCSCKVGGADESNVEIESIELTSELGFLPYDDAELREAIATLERKKVDKVEGLGLSEENYTTEEKEKLAGLENYDDTGIKKGISDLKANDALQDAELEKLSGEVYSQPFLRLNQFYSEARNRYETRSTTVTTNPIKIGRFLLGKSYLGGSSYPEYSIIYLDKDKKAIGTYTGNKSGLQEYKILREEMPNNAVYLVVNNIKDYYEESYLYTDSLYEYYENVEQLNIESGIGQKVKFTFDKVGYYDRVGVFNKSSSYLNTGFLPVLKNSEFVVYDSVGYNIAGIAFFDSNKIFLSAADISTANGVKEYILTEENIPENAVYCIASAQVVDFSLESYKAILPLGDVFHFVLSKPMNESDKEEESEVLAIYDIVSKRSSISIWLEDLPNVEKFYIKVHPSTRVSDRFSIYTADSNKGNLKQYKTAKWDTLVFVERNMDFPLLYLYENGVPITDTSYEITIYAAISQERTIRETLSWEGKNVVCFGDSITEFKGKESKRISDYIQEYTNAEVVNIGIGGTRFMQRTTPTNAPTSNVEAYAALDIVNLVTACCEQDFTKQEIACQYLNNNNAGDDNTEIIARAKSIDWNEVDIVTIMAGINDWSSEVRRGEEDSADINTTFGGINVIVQKLLTTYPHLKIYWFTPIVSWSEPRTDETWSDNKVKGGYTLKEFSAKIESVVKSHHIPICDLYNTLGWNKYNFSQYFSDNDGTHPDYGYDEIAHKMVAFINANRTF